MIVNKNIISTYAQLFEGLDSITKLELIENLSKSLKRGEKSKDQLFYESFGAFSSKKSAEEIITEIKSSRNFKKIEIKL